MAGSCGVQEGLLPCQATCQANITSMQYALPCLTDKSVWKLICWSLDSLGTVLSTSQATICGVHWQAWPCRASEGPVTCLLLPCSSVVMVVRSSPSNLAQMVKWLLLVHMIDRSFSGEPLRSARTSCSSQARLTFAAPPTSHLQKLHPVADHCLHSADPPVIGK